MNEHFTKVPTVKEMREAIGWTQQRLAENSFFSVQKIMDIEDGVLSNDSPEASFCRTTMNQRYKAALRSQIKAEDMTDETRALLASIPSFPWGRACGDIRQFACLKTMGLVEFSAVVERYEFEGHGVQFMTGRQQVRLTPAGLRLRDEILNSNAPAATASSDEVH